VVRFEAIDHAASQPESAKFPDTVGEGEVDKRGPMHVEPAETAGSRFPSPRSTPTLMDGPLAGYSRAKRT
jgi:hypothetical protein